MFGYADRPGLTWIDSCLIQFRSRFLQNINVLLCSCCTMWAAVAIYGDGVIKVSLCSPTTIPRNLLTQMPSVGLISKFLNDEMHKQSLGRIYPITLAMPWYAIRDHACHCQCHMQRAGLQSAYHRHWLSNGLCNLVPLTLKLSECTLVACEETDQHTILGSLDKGKSLGTRFSLFDCIETFPSKCQSQQLFNVSIVLFHHSKLFALALVK